MLDIQLRYLLVSGVCTSSLPHEAKHRQSVLLRRILRNSSACHCEPNREHPDTLLNWLRTLSNMYGSHGCLAMFTYCGKVFGRNVNPHSQYFLNYMSKFQFFKFECHYFVTVFATICCDFDIENKHIPGGERVFYLYLMTTSSLIPLFN
jgi:hypothetical protein